MNEIELLLSYFVNNERTSYSAKILKNEFGTLWEHINSLELVIQSIAATDIICTQCDNPHLLEVVELNEKFFACCDLTGSLQNVNPIDLVTYRFSNSNFISWLTSQLNLNYQATEIQSRFWYLGQTVKGKPDFDIYLALTDDFELATSLIKTLSKNKPKVFMWLGRQYESTKLGSDVISVSELLQLEDNSIKITKQPFTTIKSKLVKDIQEISLGDNITISRVDKKHYLHLGRNKSLNILNEGIPISPLQFNLLKYANNPKVRKNSFTLANAVEEDIATNERTITDATRKLNKLCTNNGYAKIIVKPDNHHFILNSLLLDE